MVDYVLSIDFRSPVRIGAPGLDEQSSFQSISTDQLFSWISLGWIELLGIESYKNEILARFMNNDFPWIHSDLFPDWDNTIWLPSPKWKLDTQDGKEVDKKQRTPWVSWDAFFHCLKERKAPAKNDYGRPVETHLQTNVRINRNGKDNDPYYTASVHSSPEVSQQGCEQSKFSGIIRTQDSEIVDKLRAVLNFASSNGIGGGRSSGLGAIEKISLEKADEIYSQTSKKGNGEFFVLLSTCIPNEQMIEKIKKSEPGDNVYSIGAKAGWLYDSNGRATSVRKPTTRYFESGSIFKSRPEGTMANVGTETHPAFRYGIPFFVEA